MIIDHTTFNDRLTVATTTAYVAYKRSMNAQR